MISIIKPCGQVEERMGDITLAQAQEEVGGHIETVLLRSGMLLVDEGGFRKRADHNDVASAVASRVIVGTAVLLTGGSKLDGE